MSAGPSSCVGYRGYSSERTHTAPRKVLCTYRRVLWRCVSLISSNPFTSSLPGPPAWRKEISVKSLDRTGHFRTVLQGLLEHEVHHAVGAYSRPMPVCLGPPYERWGPLCVGKPCSWSRFHSSRDGPRLICKEIWVHPVHVSACPETRSVTPEEKILY